MQFVHRREAVHFLGSPGTGKSHLAVALGIEAIRAERSIYVATLADILGMLAKAHRPDEVPKPPYCYRYEHPTRSLAERIRAGAGNLGAPMPEVPPICPSAAARPTNP